MVLPRDMFRGCCLVLCMVAWTAGPRLGLPGLEHVLRLGLEHGLTAEARAGAAQTRARAEAWDTV